VEASDLELMEEFSNGLALDSGVVRADDRHKESEGLFGKEFLSFNGPIH
jgi:hypothetical protein